MTSPSTIAVGKLDDIVRDPIKRRQFKQDPHAAMRAAGANPGDVPPEVWGTLTSMSLQELAAIGELGVALSQTGWLGGAIAWQHVV